jgi:hypothetical protein
MKFRSGLRYAALAAAAFSQSHLRAQAASASVPTITVGEDRAVSIGASSYSIIEPHLVINDKNPKHLLAGVALIGHISDPRSPAAVPDVHSCAAIASFDGGKIWTRHDFPEKECLDPWVALLPDGSAVFSGLSEAKTFTYRSADGGRTWSNKAVIVASASDHETMIVDKSSSRFSGDLYVVTSHRPAGMANRKGALVARSEDGGASFLPPTTILPFNLQIVPMNPAILSDGALVVPYVAFNRRSAAGGSKTFDNALAWVSLSSDGAKTFSMPLFVTNICGSGFSELAADTSTGAFKDRLYWVCNDRARRHVYAVHSADRGETWSEPLVLDRSPSNNPLAVHPVVAVAPDGIVGISWYDARNDPREYAGAMRCKDLYFTASSDGGKSFSEPVKVSAKESCSATPENGEAGMRWSAGGDYHGLAATGPGKFQLLWASSRDRRYELRTAEIQAVQAKPSAPK